MNGASVSVASRRAISVFADPGRPNHEDVLRGYLFAHLVVELLAAPAVANRNRDSSFGFGLAHDVPVEFFDDLFRRQVFHFSSSITMLLLVYTQISAAISRDSRTISAAEREL